MFIATQLANIFNVMDNKEALTLSQYFKPTIDGTWLGKGSLMEEILEICELVQPAADFAQSVLISMPI